MKSKHAEDENIALEIKKRPFEGQTAFIAGSTSGIALGLAEALGADGANLVINGLGDLDVIEKTRSDLAVNSGGKLCPSG